MVARAVLPALASPARASCRSRAPEGLRLLTGAALTIALAASAALPREASWLVALALVIGLGVPHGALDETHKKKYKSSEIDKKKRLRNNHK